MNFIEFGNEAGFEVLFYKNPQPMWIFDVYTLHVLEVNEAAIARYGYSREEFLTKTISDLRPPQDSELLSKILHEIRSTATNYRNFRHVTKNGRILNAEIISYSVNYKGAHARIVYARNVDEKTELAGKLKLTQRRLLQILETTIIGFLHIDFNWKIAYWNHAAEDLLGYQRDEVLGRNLWRVLPEILHSDFNKYLHQTMTSRKNIDFEDYFWPTQKWLACNAYVTEEGIILHFRDITKKRLAQDALLEKIDQLKEVSFLNSHALRKPIASLLGLTQLVSGDMINPVEFKQIASLINECSVDLDNIVKEINRRMGDNEYLQSLDIVAEVFSFSNMLRNVIKTVQPLYKPTSINLAQFVDIDFYGLKQSIELALTYVIDNAVKFSSTGSAINIKTEIVNHNLVLSVEDSGIGMSEQQLQNLFININRRKHVSLNSGLPKVNEVCRRHHGSVWIESSPGQGTVFYMRFPLSNIAAYITSGKSNFSVFKEPGCNITYVKDDNYLKLDWIGFQNFYTVRDGCIALLNQIKLHNCARVLNDNSSVTGGWMDACDWLVEELFPQAELFGVTHVAWVYSLSTFSRLSANYTVKHLKTSINIQSFYDAESARQWLINLKN